MCGGIAYRYRSCSGPSSQHSTRRQFLFMSVERKQSKNNDKNENRKKKKLLKKFYTIKQRGNGTSPSPFF